MLGRDGARVRAIIECGLGLGFRLVLKLGLGARLRLTPKGRWVYHPSCALRRAIRVGVLVAVGAAVVVGVAVRVWVPVAVAVRAGEPCSKLKTRHGVKS